MIGGWLYSGACCPQMAPNRQRHSLQPRDPAHTLETNLEGLANYVAWTLRKKERTPYKPTSHEREANSPVVKEIVGFFATIPDPLMEQNTREDPGRPSLTREFVPVTIHDCCK